MVRLLRRLAEHCFNIGHCSLEFEATHRPTDIDANRPFCGEFRPNVVHVRPTPVKLGQIWSNSAGQVRLPASLRGSTVRQISRRFLSLSNRRCGGERPCGQLEHFSAASATLSGITFCALLLVMGRRRLTLQIVELLCFAGGLQRRRSTRALLRNDSLEFLPRAILD